MGDLGLSDGPAIMIGGFLSKVRDIVADLYRGSPWGRDEVATSNHELYRSFKFRNLLILQSL